VLEDVDTALRSMLTAALPAGTAVRFDPPEPSWRGEAVGAFLYRVAEDLSARAAAWSDVRDVTGKVTARVPVSRRYQLTYLLTAWAEDVGREHALLGMALAGLGVGSSVPAQHLPESLPDVALAVASPEFPVAPLDLWSALGIPPRASFEVVLTAPMPVPVVTELAPVPDTVDLGLAGSPAAGAAPPRPSLPPPRGRITERPA